MEKLRKDFRKNGLVIIPKVLPVNLIDDLFITLVSLFKKIFPDIFYWCDDKIDHMIWYDQKFHNSIIEARNNSPKNFGAVYESMQLTSSVKKILTANEILELVSFITQTDIPNLSCRSSIIRMDCPEDNRNSIDWHSDIITFKKHFPIDGITVNIALHDVLPKHGSVKFLLNSFKEKNIQVISEGDGERDSDYYNISNKIIEKYKIFQSKEFSLGSIAIFPMSLIHKSGENISNKVRISGVFRYYPIHSKNYLFQKEEIVDSEVKI